MSPHVSHTGHSAWTPEHLKLEALFFFEISGNTNPVTLCHIQELDPQLFTHLH